MTFGLSLELEYASVHPSADPEATAIASRPTAMPAALEGAPTWVAHTAAGERNRVMGASVCGAAPDVPPAPVSACSISALERMIGVAVDAPEQTEATASAAPVMVSTLDQAPPLSTTADETVPVRATCVARSLEPQPA